MKRENNELTKQIKTRIFKIYISFHRMTIIKNNEIVCQCHNLFKFLSQ